MSFANAILRALFTAATALTGVGAALASGDFQETAKLEGSGAGPGDGLGTTIALDGDVAFVGSQLAGSFGGIYAFRFDGAQWIEEQFLFGTSDALLGYQASVSEDTALVTAYNTVTSAHFARVFRHDGSSWIPEQDLTPSDGAADFGDSNSAVFLNGDLAMVGATASGHVYVFEHDGDEWAETQKLTPGDLATWFGCAVTFRGDLAVIGAYSDDRYGLDAGAAYVFRHDGSSWSEEQRLVPGDVNLYQYFGCSVSLSGNQILVGAYGDSAQQGAVYAFAHDGNEWAETQKLVAGDAAGVDQFGLSMSASGGTMMIGAPGKDAQGYVDSGAAYRFDRVGDQWTERQQLLPSDSGHYHAFGREVAIAGRIVLAAADGHNQGIGVGFVFQAPIFSLAASSDHVNAGDTLILNAVGGLAGGPALVVVTEANAAPTWVVVFRGTFDASGNETFSATVPAGLSGLSIGFSSLGHDCDGVISLSDAELVSFL